ncbi:alpha-L RNA-binding motif-containing protein [Peniophora sp. CONT]|nr:alpha-L RNA-binding motif-containing protein [Peniophora sp. CONT]
MARQSDFDQTPATLFQQRWLSKKLIRAYHGDFVNEKAFKRWYLPRTLPDVRPREPLKVFGEGEKFVGGARARDGMEKARKRSEDGEGEQGEGIAPVGSLMLAEIERRIDVLIFRANLARSVYDARRLVVHGYVQLNGRKHPNPNTRLAPGDMISVDPTMIPFIQDRRKSKATATSENAHKDSATEASDTSTSTPATTKTDALHDRSFHLPPYASPFLFLPAYLEVSYQTCSFVYVRHPTARPGYSEIPTPYDADGDVIRRAWEWYARVRPRMRSKRQMAREPENRQ